MQTETWQTNLSRILSEAKGTWGVSVAEIGRGTYFEHLADELFIAESIIKLPIMAAVYAAAAQGRFSLDDRLALRREDLVEGSGVLFTLTPGLSLTIRELVTLMIIQSDNTATNVLIDLIGKEQIDQTMRELGMERSRYVRKLMIYPADVTETNTVAARDVARMLGRLAEGSYLSARACKEMVAILKKQQFCNGLPSLLPTAASPDGKGEHPTDWEMGSKSGWDTGRQHDAAILYARGRCFVIAALSQDVDAEEALHTLGLLGRAVYEHAKREE